MVQHQQGGEEVVVGHDRIPAIGGEGGAVGFQREQDCEEIRGQSALKPW